VMDLWWIYEVPDAQAAFAAAVVVDLADVQCKVTGARVVARIGLDDREHLFFCVRTDGWPPDDIDRTFEILDKLGTPTARSMNMITEGSGLQAMATGRPATLMAFLTWLYPGSIQINMPAGTPRINWGE
jgi:hypothetical protein